MPHREGIEKFKYYYVGIDNLKDMATKEDRVCVLNILGSESRGVTPTSHVYSGGNVVFGTMPGRKGQVLETSIGDIPVYNNVAEGMANGHKFNTAVIYIPPAAVRDAVAEVARVNPDLRKIIIITEKISVKDARIIRAIGQLRGIDIFGGNCLGVADAYNHVRIGGALGGSAPEEGLVPGTVAIFSNSGNFTTTIAVYLISNGWGSTTSISSGKDVYIHFSAPEFINAFENDDRSKAAVMYIEPGGYYEYGLEFKKPIIACIVGRWKTRLSKAVGHAGSLAGSGDDAPAKEAWFLNFFGLSDIYTPENPVFSKKGAVVTDITHIPDAMTAVMKANGIKSDFEPKGDLSKKAWFGNNQGITLPPELDAPIVEAVHPYNEQIKAINLQVGFIPPRQNLKDTSGASVMDPVTQITKVYNVSVLDATQHPLRSNMVFSLIKEHPTEIGCQIANVGFNAFINLHNDPRLIAAEGARDAGNSPNSVIASAVSIVGPKKILSCREAVGELLRLFQHSGIDDPTNTNYDYKNKIDKADAKIFVSQEPDSKAVRMLKALSNLEGKSVFIEFIKAVAKKKGGHITKDALLAGITTTVAWSPLMKKRISVTTVKGLPWYFKIFSTIIGANVKAEHHQKNSFHGIPEDELLNDWSTSEIAFLAILGRKPEPEEISTFSLLQGLLISNGPGTISAQGAKGAVSADGPEDPDRVQINKAFVGFLTHTGFAHGGNGYEAIAFLLEQFKDSGLKDPSDKNHGLDLAGIANKYALRYKDYKSEQKSTGNLAYKKIPCINHPVFKGKPINIDPREDYVRKLFEEKKSYNIFLDFYHALVEALHKNGVSPNVYCVNIDAVIAVILLKILWEPFTKGNLKEEDLEAAAFSTFLIGRMMGSAAEIDDHINRGRNMDTRTPASKCFFVN